MTRCAWDGDGRDGKMCLLPVGFGLARVGGEPAWDAAMRWTEAPGIQLDIAPVDSSNAVDRIGWGCKWNAVVGSSDSGEYWDQGLWRK